MIRFLTPFFLIGIAVAIFFMFTNPIYKDIAERRALAASYNEALNNSKAYKVARDELVRKSNAITPENQDKIKKLLPDSIDNIRLILEIGQVAAPYGMTLKNVAYDTNVEKVTGAKGTAVQGGQKEASRKDYGAWDLQFSTDGTYINFINFLKDMESNLRIVDVSSIRFSSDVGGGLKTDTALPDVYTYTFKIKTYWLKN